MARYFIGGATGFLGSHLVQAAVRGGHDVVAASRGGGVVCGVEVRRVDVADADAVKRAASGCDGAFLAVGHVSRDPEEAGALFDVHVLGTRAALGALRAAGVPRVVYVSTSGTIAVGTDPDATYDESADAPADIVARLPYYRAKVYGEREALEANAAGFEVVVVNPSLLLGPGDARESSTGDVRRFLDREVLAVPAGGVAFVDVRDAAEGALSAMARGRAGERYLLSAKNMTVAAFFRRLERISGVSAPWLRLPASRSIAVGANRLFSRAVRALGGEPPIDDATVEMGQYFWYCDARKAERELGFLPRDPGETLRDTVADLRARRAAAPAPLPRVHAP